MSRSKLRRWALVALVGLGGGVGALPGVGPRPAEAVIGRPLTPMSYAGVARRTVRRSAYYGAYYHYP
jgi:hypothetical protein